MDGAASHLYRAIDHATPSQAQEWAKRQQRLKRMVPIAPVAVPIIPEPAPKAEPVLPAVPAVKPIWFSIIEAGPRRYYIQEIQLAVCEHFGVTMRDLLSARRDVKIVLPRKIGYYLSKTLTGRSLPEVGRRFNRDHTSALAGIRKIQALVEKSDQTTIDHINAIRKLLDEQDAASSDSLPPSPQEAS
jgi:hypothetical protein